MMERMKKILIADSSEEFGLDLRQALENEPGWMVTGVASDGQQAMDLLNTTQPDVLVIDLLLPKVDGIAVLQHAASMSKPPVCMVISGFLTDYMTGTAAQLGVHYFMAKPKRQTDTTYFRDECYRKYDYTLEQSGRSGQ